MPLPVARVAAHVVGAVAVEVGHDVVGLAAAVARPVRAAEAAAGRQAGVPLPVARVAAHVVSAIAVVVADEVVALPAAVARPHRAAEAAAGRQAHVPLPVARVARHVGRAVAVVVAQRVVGLPAAVPAPHRAAEAGAARQAHVPLAAARVARHVGRAVAVEVAERVVGLPAAVAGPVAGARPADGAAVALVLRGGRRPGAGQERRAAGGRRHRHRRHARAAQHRAAGVDGGVAPEQLHAREQRAPGGAAGGVAEPVGAHAAAAGRDVDRAQPVAGGAEARAGGERDRVGPRLAIEAHGRAVVGDRVGVAVAAAAPPAVADAVAAGVVDRDHRPAERPEPGAVQRRVGRAGAVLLPDVPAIGGRVAAHALVALDAGRVGAAQRRVGDQLLAVEHEAVAGAVGGRRLPRPDALDDRQPRQRPADADEAVAAARAVAQLQPRLEGVELGHVDRHLGAERSVERLDAVGTDRQRQGRQEHDDRERALMHEGLRGRIDPWFDPQPPQ